MLAHAGAQAHTHTLALLPKVKRQGFCVGDMLKMVKHQAWATTIVAPKLIGSMTTKGQMKPRFRVNLTVHKHTSEMQLCTPLLP